MIKAIITDFDGTLVDTFEANFYAYQKAFRQVANIELDKNFYFKNFGLRIDNICKLLGIDDKSILQQIKNAKAEYYPMFFEYIYLNKDLYNTFLYYKKQGLKIALATTAAHKNLYNVLNYLNIVELFDLIICGDDVKHGKPDPEVYNVSMNKLNVSSDEIIIFEDSVAGIEAANCVTNNIIKIDINKDE